MDRAEHQLHQARDTWWASAQWGTPAFGTVETVSLSLRVNNGVATYPITALSGQQQGTHAGQQLYRLPPNCQ